MDQLRSIVNVSVTEVLSKIHTIDVTQIPIDVKNYFKLIRVVFILIIIRILKIHVIILNILSMSDVSYLFFFLSVFEVLFFPRHGKCGIKV